MLDVRYTVNSNKWSCSILNEYLEQLPARFKEKILRFRRWQDAQATLIGKLLLRNQLQTYHNDLTLNDISITDEGKPYISDRFNFNITHAGSYVICAYSDEGQIGIDLEIIDEVDVNDFKKMFTVAEFEQIKSSADPLHLFYNFWTIKEASVKADGRGLSIPLNKVRVQDKNVFIDDTRWFFKKLHFQPDYILHLVSDKIIDEPVSLLEVDFIN